MEKIDIRNLSTDTVAKVHAERPAGATHICTNSAAVIYIKATRESRKWACISREGKDAGFIMTDDVVEIDSL